MNLLKDMDNQLSKMVENFLSRRDEEWQDKISIKDKEISNLRRELSKVRGDGPTTNHNKEGISFLNLPAGVEKIFKSNGIKTVADLLLKSEDTLLSYNNFGIYKLRKLKDRLKEYNLSLATKEKENAHQKDISRMDVLDSNVRNLSFSNNNLLREIESIKLTLEKLFVRYKHSLRFVDTNPIRLGISQSTAQLLDDIPTVVELVGYTEKDLLSRPGFDEERLQEVKEKLAKFDLKLSDK